MGPKAPQLDMATQVTRSTRSRGAAAEFLKKWSGTPSSSICLRLVFALLGFKVVFHLLEMFVFFTGRLKQMEVVPKMGPRFWLSPKLLGTKIQDLLVPWLPMCQRHDVPWPNRGLTGSLEQLRP